MTDQVERFTVDTGGVTISRIVWEKFQRPMPGYVEKIIELNRGIAQYGPFLPIGLVVLIPIQEENETEQQNDIVTLWS